MVGFLSLDQTVLRAGQTFSQADPPLLFACAGRTCASNYTSSISHKSQAPALGQESNALLLVSLVPALVAICVLLCRALQHVQYRPRWLQRFVDEQIDGPKTFGAHGVKKARLGLPTTLLALTLWGTITQVVQALLWVHDVTTLPRVLAWVSYLLRSSHGSSS